VSSYSVSWESPQERARAPQPVEHGFITLPATLLEQANRESASLLARISAEGQRLRELADRVVILGIGGFVSGCPNARGSAAAQLSQRIVPRPLEMADLGITLKETAWTTIR
jgi:hypothetical protein